jgi:hypothetical protein
VITTLPNTRSASEKLNASNIIEDKDATDNRPVRPAVIDDLVCTTALNWRIFRVRRVREYTDHRRGPILADDGRHTGFVDDCGRLVAPGSFMMISRW